MAKKKKVSVGLEEADIPIIIEILEDCIDLSFCDDPDCERCVLGSITVTSFIDQLFEKLPKVDIKTEV
jgi:hypothetical protein